MKYNAEIIVCFEKNEKWEIVNICFETEEEDIEEMALKLFIDSLGKEIKKDVIYIGVISITPEKKCNNCICCTNEGECPFLESCPHCSSTHGCVYPELKMPVN